jgi:hypothetical protein
MIVSAGDFADKLLPDEEYPMQFVLFICEKEILQNPAKNIV